MVNICLSDQKMMEAVTPPPSVPPTKQEPGCRICLEHEPRGTLIAPCGCTGTSRWVHRDCLTRWMGSTNNDENRRRCEICHVHYLTDQNRPHTTYDRVLYKEMMVLSRCDALLMFRLSIVVQMLLLLCTFMAVEIDPPSPRTEDNILRYFCPLHNGVNMFDHEPLYILILDAVTAFSFIPMMALFVTMNTYRMTKMRTHYREAMGTTIVSQKCFLFILSTTVFIIICLAGISILQLPGLGMAMYTLLRYQYRLTRQAYYKITAFATLNINVLGIPYVSEEEAEKSEEDIEACSTLMNDDSTPASPTHPNISVIVPIG